MVNDRNFLYALGISALVHGSILFTFNLMGNTVDIKKHYKASVLVPVTITKKVVAKSPVKKDVPLKEPIKKKKKPPTKITKKTKVNPVPVSHKRVEKKEIVKPEEIKPVFGVTQKTVEVEKIPAVKTGIGIRVGNTLMKEQEVEYTPPEKVKSYETIPVFDLTILPKFKVRVVPEYPELLKEMEVEGEVFLSASIDDKGVVTEVRIIRSEHELFSIAAKKALLASSFVPASVNGEPVGTILDDLVYTFVLDE